jgi:hypothetical protein
MVKFKSGVSCSKPHSNLHRSGVKRPTLASGPPHHNVTAAFVSFQATMGLGVAFVPGIMAGCIATQKGKNLVSGGTAVP